MSATIVQTPSRRSSPLRPALRRWPARLLFGLLAFLVVLPLAGLTYQAVASELDRRAYPPPGQLVDIGGHRLHLLCLGEGGPTVVLETGAGAFGGVTDFSAVQPALARTTRVCAYDRAGAGWSESGPQPRTSQQAVTELHTLLQAASVPGPYVLAAFSYGGYIARLYAAQYPDEVIGLALIDAVHEDQWADPELQAFNRQFNQAIDLCARVLTPLGVWRLAGETGLVRHPVLAALPAERQGQAKAIAYGGAYCRETLAETDLAMLGVSAAQVRAANRSLGARPLVVVTAGNSNPAASDHERQQWRAWQRDLTTLSTASRQVIVPEATHVSVATADAPASVAALHELVVRVRPS